MNCAVKLNEKKRIKEESINQTVNYMLVSFATYLGDKRGWKPERICEALKWIEKHAIMISEDYTTFDEAKQALFDDYGLLFTDKGVMYEPPKKSIPIPEASASEIAERAVELIVKKVKEEERNEK